mgnify:CR=1 FL=1
MLLPIIPNPKPPDLEPNLGHKKWALQTPAVGLHFWDHIILTLIKYKILMMDISQTKQINVIIIGGKGVGKTSFLNRERGGI